jgi:hypothetical protein
MPCSNTYILQLFLIYKGGFALEPTLPILAEKDPPPAPRSSLALTPALCPTEQVRNGARSLKGEESGSRLLPDCNFIGKGGRVTLQFWNPAGDQKRVVYMLESFSDKACLARIDEFLIV